ncbi:MAG TPA: HEAT repeat domain-containing protein [Methylomirabilota bacterium]|nr:HEAT repeat domain-containing protein [Methylomirabilota bacterium]
MSTQGPPPTLLEVVSSLVTAWRNLAAYPAGHPARSSALGTAHTRLRAALAVTSPLVLGIAHDGLVSGGKKLEAAHVRTFARALYRRNGGLLRIEEGVQAAELERFLAMLGDTGPARDRALTGDDLAAAGITHIQVSAIDYSSLVTTTDITPAASEESSLWDSLLQALLADQPIASRGGPTVSRDRYSAETIASLFRGDTGTGGPGGGGPGGGGPEGGGTGGPGGGGSSGRGRGGGAGRVLGQTLGGTESATGGTGTGGRLGMAGAQTLASLVGARLASADSDEREKLTPQIIQLLRALPGEIREPVLAAALRTLATDEASSAHLASLAAALPAADVLRGLRRLAEERGQLSGHALRMARALAEAHEEMGPAPALPEPPADFAEMAALFREEDVDRYNPEDHRALLAQKPTVDLAAIAVQRASDPDAFGPDTESDDAIERRLVTTLLDMTADSPDIVQPLVLGRLREMFVRALQLNRFTQAIGVIRATRELAADPGQAERRAVLDEFLISLADARTLAALVAASRQPGGPPFVQVQSLVLALGASAARGLLEALAAEPDRARRLRLIELAASLGAAIVPETRRLLADPRWYVVRNMVLLLRRVQDRSAMNEIRRCADHSDLRVRLEAIRALFTFDPKVPRDLLARTIHHSDPRLAEAAVLLTGQHGITQAIDLLVEILLRWDVLGRRRSLRLKALRALADLADPAVLPRLGRFFREWPFPLAALEERRAAYRFLHAYDAAARAVLVARGQKSRDPVIRDICRGLAKASAAREGQPAGEGWPATEDRTE